MTESSSSEEFQLDYLSRKVLNIDVTFNWIGESDCFWFKRQTPAGDDFVVVDAQTGAQSLAADPLTAPAALHAARLDWVISPDGAQAVLRRGYDLWLRDLSTGEERRLTHDGEADFGYGDFNPAFDLQEVTRRR